MTKLPWLLLPCAMSTACVMDPVWGENATRRDRIDFDGTASRANAPIQIQAFNRATGTFDTIASFTGGSQQLATSPALFGWSHPGVTIDDAHWTSANCGDPGMADLRVLEINTDGSTRQLATFDSDGKQCLNDHMAAGEHPVTAGNACKQPDSTIVLFAPPQCVMPVLAGDPTAPTATVRISNATDVWKATSGGGPVNAPSVPRTLLTAVASVRDLDGAVRTARLSGSLALTCRRPDGTTLSTTQPISQLALNIITAGTPAQIGADATLVIDPAHLCATGYTLVNASGTLTASGVNASNTNVVSPALSFTMP